MSVSISSSYSPVWRIFSSTLSGVKPNWVMMKDGVLSSFTARCSDHTASSAVTGAPEWKVASSRSLKR